jgi:hypothetical protein
MQCAGERHEAAGERWALDGIGKLEDRDADGSSPVTGSRSSSILCTGSAPSRAESLASG